MIPRIKCPSSIGTRQHTEIIHDNMSNDTFQFQLSSLLRDRNYFSQPFYACSIFLGGNPVFFLILTRLTLMSAFFKQIILFNTLSSTAFSIPLMRRGRRWEDRWRYRKWQGMQLMIWRKLHSLKPKPCPASQLHRLMQWWRLVAPRPSVRH